MTAGARTSVVLLAGTVIFLVLSLAVVPMHVSLGAGSLRCGTGLNPEAESEIGDLCTSARPDYIRAALMAGGALAVIAALPWIASRLGAAARPVLIGLFVSWLVVASVALLWIAWFMEYSPPHEVFDL